MGTGVGNISIDECIKQMKEAFDNNDKYNHDMYKTDKGIYLYKAER